MTVEAVNNAPASTLTAVIRQVREALDAIGEAAPVIVGASYLEFGAGSPPRILFVPELRGEISDAIKQGNSASMIHSCNLYVRAAEISGSDEERFDATYALADIVIDCIQTAAPGRIVWGPMSDSSPTRTGDYGTELEFFFRYQRDIPHNAKRWALNSKPDTSAQRPLVPPGKPFDPIVNVSSR